MLWRNRPASGAGGGVAVGEGGGDVAGCGEAGCGEDEAPLPALPQPLPGEEVADLVLRRGQHMALANVGTRVTVTNLANNEREEYSLMGAWDGDPDNNRISYLTPLGQAIFRQ